MALVTVRATKLGYYDLKRKREGEVFQVEESQVSKQWMELVSPKKSVKKQKEEPKVEELEEASETSEEVI